MNTDLYGKTALVCGSTQGIGKASAIELSMLGASIVLMSRNEQELIKSLSELSADRNQKHEFIIADFSKPETVKQGVDKYLAAKRTVHVLVNNTGGPPGGNICEAKTDDFLMAFTSHLISSHILAQACIPGMKEEGYGRIINIISTSVKQPIKGLGVSNTVRAAVGNWSKTLSFEVAKYGITVNNVLPGATATSRLIQIIEAKAAKSGKSIEAITEEMTQEIPSIRFGMPEEIANAVAFLASPAASYINGINLPVDGGRTGNL